jgi:hypothetical protein
MVRLSMSADNLGGFEEHLRPSPDGDVARSASGARNVDTGSSRKTDGDQPACRARASVARLLRCQEVRQAEADQLWPARRDRTDDGLRLEV